MAGTDIDEYYLRIKQSDFETDLNDDPVFFYPKKPEKMKVNLLKEDGISFYR